MEVRRLVAMHAVTPNPSVHSDVPYAGLRPRNGPPVNLFR
jgi:hypothetical protein